MQTDGFGATQKYSSMRDCFAKTYAIEGLGGFWKGIAPTLLRAMPVSAGTFVVYVLPPISPPFPPTDQFHSVELAMKALA